jgi:predicted metalloprotease
VSGFQEGYDGGAEACRDAFGDGQRVFTQASFSDLELAQQDPGNAAYPNTVDFTVTSLEEVWSGAFTALFGETFTAPAVVPFDGSPPDCGDLDADDLDLGYCPDDQTVYFDETDLTVPAYELGDFAVATAISLPYADAAREQLGLTGNDDEATRSTVCLSGWYAAQIYNGEVTDLSLSPGDLDEAISFLLAYGRDPSVLPDTELSGFELVDSYRSGFFQGAVACDVGL